MSNTLTLIGSSLVRLAYAVLLVVFAATPAVSLAFGDTGMVTQAVDRDAEATVLSPSSTRVVAEASVSNENVPSRLTSTLGTSHSDTSSVSAMPCWRAAAPHCLTLDRPEASVPEIAAPSAPCQNTLAPNAVAPDALDPDDLVANDLAPPTGEVLSTAAGQAKPAETPCDTAGLCARQGEATDAADPASHSKLDTSLSAPASSAGEPFDSDAASGLETSPADKAAGCCAVPNAGASANGAFSFQKLNNSAGLDSNFSCSEAAKATGRVVVS